MNHVWGLFSHPDREMQVIKSENETVSHHYTHHVLLMAAIPVVCAFIGTTQIGWNFGDGNVLQLSLFTAFALAVLFYGVMLAGVAVMGRVIWWMARNYPQRPSLARCMVFAGYVATPLFLSGLVALYPWYGYAHWSALSRSFTPAICCIWVFRLSLTLIERKD
ncbi:membrane protein [Salmonella enterica subsp. enterica]|nr:membrane protein [Salmonella enterica subsp. enterica]